jgi:hypothetical protein
MVAILLLATPSLVWGKKHTASSHVYTFTYDEVFAATGDAVARMGLLADAQDKAKGTISGHGLYKPSFASANRKFSFEITVETVSSKPETRVTVLAKIKELWVLGGDAETELQEALLGELNKVLLTYK